MRRKFFAAVLLFGMIGLGDGVAHARETLLFATGEWPPYTSEKLAGHGFFTELVTEVVQEMGMTPEYTFYPWKRCEISAEKGHVFGIFPYALTAERMRKFNFSDVIVKNRSLFFYNKKHLVKKPEVNSLADLKPYRIGGVLGYHYEKAFEAADLKVDYVTDDALNLKKLYANRIEIITMDSLLGKYLIQQMYPDETDMFGILDVTLEAVAPALKEGDSYLMISKTYPDFKALQDRFNAALQRIRENGVYNRILKKYEMPER